MPDGSAMYAGDWVARGPKVHGRRYLKLEEWNGMWVALVRDEQLDTRNAELLLLNDSRDAGSAAEGIHNSSTVSLSTHHISGVPILQA